MQAHTDIRWCNARKVDLRQSADVIPAVRFNLDTKWPKPDRLPPGVNPGQLLTNAMNPGLGVRELHRAGITGERVHVAIVDYDIQGFHPEYARQIVEIHRVNTKGGPSMHGPAVASLLVGQNCGTAPGARVHFIVTPDGSNDAAHDAEALRWVMSRNKQLPAAEQIRIVSVSASPSGRARYRFRNSDQWDAAVREAEATGLLVIDGTEHHSFVGPCNLDPSDPENPAKVRPVLAKGLPEFFKGRILVPTGPRTTAEEYHRKEHSYQYCGFQKETSFGAGSSWAMPYCAGVLAMGLQLQPDLSAADLRALLFQTAYTLPGGEKVIDPKGFIEAVKKLDPWPDGSE